MSHSTRTWSRTCLGVRASHDRWIRLTSRSGSMRSVCRAASGSSTGRSRRADRWKPTGASPTQLLPELLPAVLAAADGRGELTDVQGRRRARHPRFRRSRALHHGGGWGIRTPEGVTPTRFPSASTGGGKCSLVYVPAGQRGARMIRTTSGSGWIGKNCYQNCYPPLRSPVLRFPRRTLRRPSAPGRRAVKCRAEKPADETHRGGVRRQALARADLPCDGWVEPIPVRRRRELRVTVEATVDPLGADRADERVTVDVLRPGEHHEIDEVTHAARRATARRAVRGLRRTQLVSDMVNHGVQAHRRG